MATVYGWASPPLNFEYLLSQTFASTKRNGGTQPSMVEAAYLLGRYRSEFAIADIPKPVQTLPLIRLVGKINGVSKRYTDAPPPAAALTTTSSRRKCRDADIWAALLIATNETGRLVGEAAVVTVVRCPRADSASGR